VQDWADFAHNWRSTYYTFTRELASNPSGAYKTVDDHHFDSLIELLTEKGLQLPGDARSSLYGDEQLRSLSMVWHCLDPWPDTTAGLGLLNKQFITCTLSNGNISLLNDMVKHANMDFTHIFSAEMFQSYKPSPKVYLGAVQKLGLRPEECCMVAAHLDDLKHAKSNGLRTLYVERKAEERFPDLRDEGFVDYWVSEDEDGFGAAAHKLATGV
jgi:2-haloacid dehalogenase